MNNADSPASPFQINPSELAIQQAKVGGQVLEPFHYHGLTKREAFTLAAMQGLSANPIYNKEPSHLIAGWAVEQADETLKALEERAKDGAK